MPADVLVALGQFGAAGLIGMLWLLERRHASARDRQLTEAHERLRDLGRDRAALLSIIRDNTRAITSLEASQQRLTDVLQHVTRRHEQEV